MSLCAFDDLVTTPECGFADGRDCYARCSSRPRLGSLDVPTVILTAGTTPSWAPPFFGARDLGARTLLHVEPCGGHVGYLARGLKQPRWTTKRLFPTTRVHVPEGKVEVGHWACSSTSTTSRTRPAASVEWVERKAASDKMELELLPGDQLAPSACPTRSATAGSRSGPR